jgi:hypothetical protein
MNLSSDELEILEYLKSWKGTSVSIMEISRCAGGRKKYKDSPHWAKGLMSRLVENDFVFVNDRGHYCCVLEKGDVSPPPDSVTEPVSAPVDDNYFPVDEGPPVVVGEDYFPTSSETQSETSRWISPQIADILKKSGKKFDGQDG